MRSQIKDQKLSDKVTLHIVPSDKLYNQQRQGDGSAEDFRSGGIVLHIFSRSQ